MNGDTRDILVQKMRRRFWLKMAGWSLFGMVCVAGFVFTYWVVPVFVMFIVYLFYGVGDWFYRCPFCRKKVKRIPVKPGAKKSYFAYVLPDRCPHCSLELKVIKYLFRWPTKRSSHRSEKPMDDQATLQAHDISNPGET